MCVVLVFVHAASKLKRKVNFLFLNTRRPKFEYACNRLKVIHVFVIVRSSPTTGDGVEQVYNQWFLKVNTRIPHESPIKTYKILIKYCYYKLKLKYFLLTFS
jgi:hypothetical protein